MSISFDKALGIHEKALGFRAQRAEVLANNITNADTPNYKARDMDFSSVLAAESDKQQNGRFAL
ncbi:MAG: flagellar basal body rod protein FlgB, partial [Pseudomonas sp.]